MLKCEKCGEESSGSASDVGQVADCALAERDALCVELEPWRSGEHAELCGLRQAFSDVVAEKNATAEEAARLRARVTLIGESVWSFTDLDIEHTISCHADSLPEAYRRACAALDAARAAGTPPDLVSEVEKSAVQP